MSLGFQSRKASRGGAISVLTQTRGITVVCLLVLALLMLVQVVHTHPFNTDADHCPVCVVMHSAAPVAAAAAILISFSSAAPLAVASARPRARDWHFELFTRPPPFQR